MAAVVLALVLVQFTTPAGGRVDINPNEIASISEPRHGTKLYSEHVHCLIGLSNGKFVPLGDECTAVRRKLMGHEPHWRELR